MGQRLRRLLLLLALLLCAGAVPASMNGAAAPHKIAQVFDLTISLEWQPGSEDRLPDDLALAGCPATTAKELFVDDLAASVYESAAYLYYFSEGQMALRNVAIYTGGENWDTADIRILASNSYRPTAFVGGIVDTPTLYFSMTTSVTPTVFAPAAILLGRLWSGRGALCGPWSAPAGWRTIGHEWGHYALYLYDEYFDIEMGAEQYCTTTGLDLSASSPVLNSLVDSLMAYHYTADKLWLTGDAPPRSTRPAWSCANTPQLHVHGATDWETIARFYPVSLPAALRSDLVFAGSPAEALLNISVAAPATPREDTSAEVRLERLPIRERGAQAYLFRPGADGAPLRIIGQGQLVAGGAALPFWGVFEENKDRAAVFMQDFDGGKRYAFPANLDAAPPLDVTAANTISLAATIWQPALSITPVVFETESGISEIGGLRVDLKDCASTTKSVKLSYCPAGSDCSEPVLVSGDNSFTHTFWFPLDGKDEPPALHGYIYARSLDTSEELISWYQIGGGVGPAHTDTHAPLVDGLVQVDLAPSQAGAGADSRLLFSPAQVCSAPASLPPDVLGIAGTPFNIQPVIANFNGGQGWGSNPADPPLRVRLGYSEDLLDRLGIGEEQLVILGFDDGQGVWQILPEAGRSTVLDWIAADPQRFNGEGAIYALGYARARVALPLIMR